MPLVGGVELEVELAQCWVLKHFLPGMCRIRQRHRRMGDDGLGTSATTWMMDGRGWVTVTPSMFDGTLPDLACRGHCL